MDHLDSLCERFEVLKRQTEVMDTQLRTIERRVRRWRGLDHFLLCANMPILICRHLDGQSTSQRGGASMYVRAIIAWLIGLSIVVLSSVAYAQIPIVAVTAKSWQEPNRPINTLSNDTTRWSAEGKGQWIRYEFAEPWTLTGVHLRWLDQNKRQQTFIVQISKDGTSGWRTLFQDKYVKNTWIDLSAPFAAKFARIVGYGNTVNQWNSLEFIQWFGTSAHYTNPVYEPWEIVPPGREENDPYSVEDGTLSTGVLVSNGEHVWIELHAENGTVAPMVPCLALAWNTPTTFTVYTYRQEGPDSYAFYPIIQDSQAVPGLRVYQTDPTIIQANTWWNILVVETLDSNRELELSEAYMLRDCNDQPGRHYASSVSASTYQNNAKAVNPPANTLDNNATTRWSAEGDGQWIAYRLLENTYRALGIKWHLGTTRTASFDIEMSLDGVEWYPVFSGQSRKTAQVEWYEFPPTYGEYIRIVGYGNSQNDWNSILEVQFGTPEPALVAAK